MLDIDIMLYTTRVILKADSRIILVGGDSGTGKTFLYNSLQGEINGMHICRVDVDSSEKMFNFIADTERDSLIMVDRADIWLTDTMKQVIAADINNTYLVFGRNPDNLNLTFEDMYELNLTKQNNVNTLTLVKAFNINT